MNKWIGIGRLVRQPDVRYTQDGNALAKFTVAVDRRVKRDGEQTADFISCTAFRKTAEFVQKYLSKGTKVLIEGRWQTGSYTNKEGQKIYTNDCMVDSIEFAESKKSNTQESPEEFMDVPDEIDQQLPFN